MSSPRTNLEKQTKRHRGPLIGIGLATLFGAILAVLIVTTAIPDDEDGAPDGTQTQFEERIGEEAQPE